jgi:hypothetical protein
MSKQTPEFLSTVSYVYESLKTKTSWKIGLAIAWSLLMMSMWPHPSTSENTGSAPVHDQHYYEVKALAALVVYDKYCGGLPAVGVDSFYKIAPAVSKQELAEEFPKAVAEHIDNEPGGQIRFCVFMEQTYFAGAGAGTTGEGGSSSDDAWCASMIKIFHDEPPTPRQHGWRCRMQWQYEHDHKLEK